MILRNKKGLASLDVMMRVIHTILLAIVLSFIPIVIYMLVNEDIPLENLRSEIFIERILSSPDCLAYFDEDTQRTYPNIVNLSRFSASVLDECIDYGHRDFMTARLNLVNLESLEEQAIYYNEDKFKDWDIYSFDRKYYYKTEKNRYILVRGEEDFRARLNVEIITQTG